MQEINDEQVRQAVRKTYGDIAKADSAGCGCCSANKPTAKEISVGLGYSQEDVSTVPEGSNMGLGCGNPQAIASLKAGETVLDLGSGGGFDCFLAARAVGDKGQVIGIDMTPDMVSKARQNAQKIKLNNVDFRLGEIENLPVADSSVDVIISNCVINLSTDKGKVYKEAFRVLKKGGRLAVSDVVATAKLPDEARKDLELRAGFISGAEEIEEIISKLKKAGFNKISVTPSDKSQKIISNWTSDRKITDFIAAASIEAIKP